MPFPAVFDVASLNSSNGFKLTSTSARFGVSVAGAGDVNGDEIQDLIIGTTSGSNTAYVIFGASSFPATLSTTALNGTNGFKIISSVQLFGTPVAGAGDINGDRKSDLIIGASNQIAYVIFGASNFPAVLPTTALNGTNGFSVSGSYYFGVSAAGIADINGDGKHDLIMGTGSSDNSAYVIFGASNFPAVLSTAALNGANGFRLTSSSASFGSSVAGAGDVNNDGKLDLIVGAPSANTAYVVFGASNFPAVLSTATLNGTNGFRLTSSSSNFGVVARAGDINMDGRDDLIVGSGANIAYIIFGTNSFQSILDTSSLNGTNGFNITSSALSLSGTRAGDINEDWKSDLLIGTSSNVAYVMFGASDLPGALNTSALNGTNGFKIISSSANFGSSVAEIGDINSDGKTDIVIGAYGSNAAYVIFGQSSSPAPAPSPSPAHALLPQPLPFPSPDPNCIKGTFPAFFDLRSLNGNNGFVINGTASEGRLGYSVSGAGDIDGDGKSDVIIGETGTRRAYVIFGRAGVFPMSFNLTSLNGVNGFIIIGPSSSGFGSMVSDAGDVNGDGKGDLILGAQNANPVGTYGTGQAYIIFGRASPFPHPFNINSLNGSNGFIVNGLAESDYLGWSVSGAGDVNGDGNDDVIIGAHYATTAGLMFVGQVYVIFGKLDPFVTPFNLTSLDGNNGFVINGLVTEDFLGHSVNDAGDVNGDSMDDIIIGAPEANPSTFSKDAGQVYVMFGRSVFPPIFDLNSLNGSNGFRIDGVVRNGLLGFWVSGAGDVNDDGKSDLVMEEINGARAHVVFGSATPLPHPFDLNSLNGTNGFSITKPDSGSGIWQVSSAGDINADGKDDVMITAHTADANGLPDVGQVHIFFGKNTTYVTPFNANNLNGIDGFSVNGLFAYGQLGKASDVGDFNGDSVDDIVVGAFYADADGITNSGQAYVIFGQEEYCPPAVFVHAPSPLPTPSPYLMPAPNPHPMPAPSPTPYPAPYPLPTPILLSQPTSAPFLAPTPSPAPQPIPSSQNLPMALPLPQPAPIPAPRPAPKLQPSLAPTPACLVKSIEQLLKVSSSSPCKLGHPQAFERIVKCKTSFVDATGTHISKTDYYTLSLSTAGEVEIIKAVGVVVSDA